MLKTGYLFTSLITLITLQACNTKSEAISCIDAHPAVDKGAEFFTGVAQPLTFSKYSSRPIAVSCHNCYRQSSTEDTISIIKTAIEGDADSIELDVLTTNIEAPIIAHDPDSDGVFLNGIVGHELLIESTRILFVELKDIETPKEEGRKLLRLLKRQKKLDGKYAYFNSERFTVIRHADGYDTLSNFRDVLAEAEFTDIQPFVKLSRIYFPAKHINIEQVHQCGYHMVEFDHRIGSETIQKKALQAKSLGLGVNLFTLEHGNFKVILSDLSLNIDSVTIEPNTVNTQLLDDGSIFEQVKQFINNG